MPDRIFIDSNIFIYAKVQEGGESKHEFAQKFLESVNGKIIISTQVLSEFYNVLNRYKIDDSIIQEHLEARYGKIGTKKRDESESGSIILTYRPIDFWTRWINSRRVFTPIFR